jgi:hypothetical protein
MKKILIAISTIVSLSALAQVYQNGYTRSDGTYVAPTYRSSPNTTTNDNYGTQGNYNPYTGKQGTKR